MSFPLNKQLVDQTCIDFGLRNAKELGASSIRQLVGVVKDIERATGVEFIHGTRRTRIASRADWHYS